ncbi:WD repeat-containing protein 70-like isoform X1 [Biomphalaria glabrata]|uniref:WD repeat-containing protein 70 n=2 Tax=Biomphalaria glabrata TaxID=6526 RepID=A0A9W3AGF9_BIOGL|nr:WD repeat-containing protein 70-like isoform X1 [Biomphalaria glabrata]
MEKKAMDEIDNQSRSRTIQTDQTVQSDSQSNEKKGHKDDKDIKKARNFDFMAMFHEARQTAKERTLNNIVADSDLADIIEPEIESQSKTSPVPSPATKISSTKSPVTKVMDNDSNSAIEDSEDEIGPSLPSDFTNDFKTETRITPNPQDDEMNDNSGDDSFIGPPIPTVLSMMSAETSENTDRDHDSDEDDEAEDDENPLTKIPQSHEIILNHGAKTVSALALDPSGARLVTGSFDFDVKLWDFAGMDTSLRSFRSLRPSECHQIKGLEYSITGDTLLVVAGNAQAKIIDRDGFEVMECVKGDQYLVDQASTKGHTASLNSGCWNPKLKEEFLTCANDCTLRLWDVNKPLKHKNIIKTKSTGGRKTIPTSCTYSLDGRYIVAGCNDGSIQLWDYNKHTYVNVAIQNKNAHMNGSDITCLRFSYDGRTLASRGGDDTLKLWDIRSFQKPLNIARNLDNRFPMTDCIFSPDDKLVVTGVSLQKNQTEGKIVFLDRESLAVVKEMHVSESSTIRVLWHPKLNQMVVGCGDGLVKLYYDPKKSHRGAMLCMVKRERKVKQAEIVAAQNIITPYALPMFRQGRPTSTRKFDEKVRKDPVKSHRPDLPVSGPGTGGRVGAKGATLSQYVAQQIVSRKPDPFEKDPRAAILRHAKEASENPYWIDPAYKKTQPNPVFRETEDDEDDKKDEDEPGPIWKKKKLQ